MRYGVLLVLRGRGVSFGEILLDGATEPRAKTFCSTGNRLSHTDHGNYAVGGFKN